METMEDFLQRKYIDFVRDKGRLTSAADFAKWIGVSNTSLSQWMNGRRQPTGDNVHLLAAKLGPEVYDILGLRRLMPDDPKFLEYAKKWFDADRQTRDEVMRILNGSEETTAEKLVAE